MGIINNDHYDAFFSYAHDDDSYHDGWVHDFHEELEKKYGELLRKKISDYPILRKVSEREPKFFIDNNGLPANGELTHELEDAIKNSEFLFVFVGTKYLDSDWCGKEINSFFKSLSNQNKREIYERLFIIVLEAEALQKSWINSHLGKAKEEAIYLPFFDDNGSPIPPNLPINNELKPNPKISISLHKLAETMVKRTVHLIEHPGPVLPKPSQLTNGITIGVIRPNLGTATDQLLEQLLKDNGDIAVEKLTQEDLLSEDVDKILMDKLARSAVFVQPFDHGKVLMRLGGLQGGHLKIQENIINNRIPIVWWHVPSALGGIEADNEQAETLELHTTYLATLDEQARQGDVDEMATHILDIICPHPILPTTVFIESTVEDADITRLLGEKLRQLWNSNFGSGARLFCSPMPWAELSKARAETLKKCGGVIFIYGHKDIDALIDQIQKFEGMIFDIRIDPGRAVAIVLPIQKFAGDVGLETCFTCEKTDDQLIVDEEKVKNFLRKVHRSSYS
jgi:hypothetical protein